MAMSGSFRPWPVRTHTTVDPAGTPTFYGMFYDEKPVYHDPPSNQWFGFQAWSMERVAEYYQQTGDADAKVVLPQEIARTILDGFDRHYRLFREAAVRAQTLFEQAAWPAMRASRPLIFRSSGPTPCSGDSAPIST